MRAIMQIRKELTEAKRRYRNFIRQVGDDMGCDGTDGEAQGYRWDVENLEDELNEARAARSNPMKEGQRVTGFWGRNVMFTGTIVEVLNATVVAVKVDQSEDDFPIEFTIDRFI